MKTESWKTFGHESQKRLLDRQLAAGQLAHAYLFTGPAGVGKKMLAVEFAGRILHAGNPSSHPDFFLYEPQGDILLEQMQEFQSRLSLKPFAGKYSIAILDGAERMNTQSANALLKSLEEPAANAIAILIAANNRILPTIISRCQQLAFHSFSLPQLREYCSERGVQGAPEALEVCSGSIGTLTSILAAGTAGADFRLIGRFESLLKAPLSERLLAASEFAEKEPEELERLFILWLHGVKRRLGQEPGSYRTAWGLLEALRSIRTNKNKKLILQGLLLNPPL